MENFSFTKFAEELDSAVNGVSFEGKTLKWETEEQVKPVIEEMNKCQKLLYLNLEGNTLGVEAAKAIGKALETHPEFQKALWKDLFTGRLKTEIPLALKEMGLGITKANAHLTVLDCSDNALGPNGMAGLVDLIKSPACYSLQELKLNNCGLGIQGGKMLANALLSCHESSVKAGTPLKLKVFIAGRNRLENEGGKALGEVFAKIKTLEEVTIPQNGIYHVGIAALSEGFKQNPNMKVLNLNDNTITAKGAEHLSNAFSSMQNLKEINFGDCLLKTKGAVLLAEALQDQHTDLEVLILEANEIGMDGGITVATAMGNKENLKKLNLDSNQFGEEGCLTIQDVMAQFEKSDCLQSLDNDEGNEDEEEEDYGEEQDDDDDEDNDYEEEDEDESEVNDNSKCDKSGSKLLEDEYDVNYIAAFKNKSLDNNADDSFLTAHNDSAVIFVKEEELPNTIENFVDSSITSLKMFNGLTETNKLEAFKEYLKDFKDDEYLVRLTFLVLKCSDLSEESTEALDIALELYKETFDYAKQTNEISRVRTFFLIQLGLLKSEDKSFRPLYNFKICRNVAKKAIEKKLFPDDVETTFKLFLERFA